MKINLTVLSFVLILIAVYLFLYQILPLYKSTLSLAKEVSFKKSQKEKIIQFKTAIENLNQDPIFQELLSNKEKFNSYLPPEPVVEGVISDILSHYENLRLSQFPGFSYRIKDADFSLPVNLATKPKIVEFNIKDNMSYQILVSLLKLMESNIRLLSIQGLKVNKDERKQILNVDFHFNAYYLE
jgi:hypothetical protein